MSVTIARLNERDLNVDLLNAKDSNENDRRFLQSLISTEKLTESDDVDLNDLVARSVALKSNLLSSRHATGFHLHSPEPGMGDTLTGKAGMQSCYLNRPQNTACQARLGQTQKLLCQRPAPHLLRTDTAWKDLAGCGLAGCTK